VIFVNAALLLIIIALIVGVLNARTGIEAALRRAQNMERQANESLAHASKVERDNNDLRARLAEQGKVWSARLRKQQNKK
jgi:hypothetical protein